MLHSQLYFTAEPYLGIFQDKCPRLSWQVMFSLTKYCVAEKN